MFLIVGDTAVARRTHAALRRRGLPTSLLTAASDDELRAAMRENPRGIAILTHNDVTSLRYALAAAHINSAIPMVVTIFDRTIGDQLATLLPQCHVTSPADLAAPSLAGPCVEPTLLATSLMADGQITEVSSRDNKPHRRNGIRRRHPRWHILLTNLTGLLRIRDKGTRMLLWGLGGLVTILLTDWTTLCVFADRTVAEALHEAVAVIATVGPAADAHGSTGYAVFASMSMAAAVVFTAMFTAGMVDRILGPRLHGLLGSRVVPHSGHVIVVGLGQVGLRLCREMRDLGIPVVGVERDSTATNLRLVRAMRIPVVIGHGSDRGLLEKVGVHRARAVAALGSDDLDNIAVAIAVTAVAPSSRVIIRAGEHEAIAETRSLLPLGTILDVASLSAAYVVAHLLGQRPRSVISANTVLFVETGGGIFTEFLLLDEPSSPATVQVALAHSPR